MQPRQVPAQQVQFALLASGDILARQHARGLRQGSKAWQAIEFALVKGWIGDKNTDPQTILTRAAAARILVAAFLNDDSAKFSVTQTTGGFDQAPRSLKQSYPDVPLYSSDFNVVTSLRRAAAIPPCTRDHKDFCPDDPMHVNDFLQLVTDLTKKEGWVQDDRKSELLSPAEYGRQQLTVEKAAIILYDAARNRRDIPTTDANAKMTATSAQ
jgi:hypothetical protein